MASMNISLPQQMRDWFEEQAASGRYANASDYMRDLIRRDQERQEAIAHVQQAIDEALASGPPEEFDPDLFEAEMRRKYG